MKNYLIAAFMVVGVAGTAEAQKTARQTQQAVQQPRLKTTATTPAAKAPKVKRSEPAQAPITSREQARNKQEALQADAHQRQQAAKESKKEQ
jgi:hypothetical protein